MENYQDYQITIFEEEGLFGAKAHDGNVIIKPQFSDMRPFSCGLSLVRNDKNQFAYIDKSNRFIVPYGTFDWCDSQFVCGVARVMNYNPDIKQERWGIISTLGNVIVPLKYDSIWPLKEEYLFSVRAYIGDKEEILNLHHLANKIMFSGLSYISAYTVEAFKGMTNCKKIFIKLDTKTHIPYFVYGTNIGYVASAGKPKNPVISIVSDNMGKIFPLLMEKDDIGKSELPIIKLKPAISPLKGKNRKTSFWDYEEESMNDSENWTDPYGDNRAYYGGWSEDEVDSMMSDAFE